MRLRFVEPADEGDDMATNGVQKPGSQLEINTTSNARPKLEIAGPGQNLLSLGYRDCIGVS